jgi:hypothetical protein
MTCFATRSLKSWGHSTDEREVIMCALCGESAKPTDLFCRSCAAPIEPVLGDAPQFGVARIPTRGYYRPSSALLLDPPMSRAPATPHDAMSRSVSLRLAVGLALGLAVGGLAFVQIAAAL